MTGSTCQLQALEAVLFVSELDGQPDDRRRMLSAILVRLGVQCDDLRTVALLDEPVLGRQYQVRVTPCLVLDTGTRRVQLLGEPAAMDTTALELALARA